jgi:hypothetical protein
MENYVSMVVFMLTHLVEKLQNGEGYNGKGHKEKFL